MDSSRFDRISKRLAQLRHTGRAPHEDRAAAQAATPVATPGAIPNATTHKPVEFFFVQGYESGILSAKIGAKEKGTFTLTLHDGLGHTIYFSDRPDRVAGALPTEKFLASFPFGTKNPPNAALVMEVASDDEDVVVMELTNPAYDSASRTATYDARVLADYKDLGVTFQEAPQTADSVQHQFGAASLFIDDCPDGFATCYSSSGDKVGTITTGCCWHWVDLGCTPCESANTDAGICNSTYSACNGNCTASTYCSSV